MPGQGQTKYNQKRLAALGALILLVIVLLILVVLWFIPRPTTPQPVAQPVEQAPVVVPVTSPVATSVPPTVQQPSDGELQVASLARNFAERYGSWSTQSDFQNLKDLYPNITPRLKAEFELTIARGEPQESYRGATVKALSVAVSDLQASSARATVMVQQITTDDQLRETRAVRTLDLTLYKQSDFWYVDTATWKE